MSRPVPDARPRPRTAKAVQADRRPLSELKFEVRIAPPDGDRDAADQIIPVQLAIDLLHFSLAERQLAKRALTKFVQPHDWEDIIVTHAWVVWRRTHPESSLQFWMDHIDWGDLLNALELEPGRVEWDTTPEGFDPEA